eukprot:Filipodium_phascolosomae@DN4437_c0_g1_i1.p1
MPKDCRDLERINHAVKADCEDMELHVAVPSQAEEISEASVPPTASRPPSSSPPIQPPAPQPTLNSPSTPQPPRQPLSNPQPPLQPLSTLQPLPTLQTPIQPQTLPPHRSPVGLASPGALGGGPFDPRAGGPSAEQVVVFMADQDNVRRVGIMDVRIEVTPPPFAIPTLHRLPEGLRVACPGRNQQAALPRQTGIPQPRPHAGNIQPGIHQAGTQQQFGHGAALQSAPRSTVAHEFRPRPRTPLSAENIANMVCSRMPDPVTVCGGASTGACGPPSRLSAVLQDDTPRCPCRNRFSCCGLRSWPNASQQALSIREDSPTWYSPPCARSRSYPDYSETGAFYYLGDPRPPTLVRVGRMRRRSTHCHVPTRRGFRQCF